MRFLGNTLGHSWPGVDRSIFEHWHAVTTHGKTGLKASHINTGESAFALKNVFHRVLSLIRYTKLSFFPQMCLEH